MPPRRPPEDPYRTLGVLPGADTEAIKAAHRRLAKRFHPDGSMGDEGRFLAIQEAYQLLTDPLRRREWDRRHASGPLPARDQGAAANRTATRRGTRRTGARPQPKPGVRHTTWSAQHVPWWQDFQPRARDAGRGSATDEGASMPPRNESTQSPGVEPADAPDAERPGPSSMDFDVFSRSSGAAWSMAARRHFRRGDADLPSRGAWRYRGTQVVTGALARQLAEEEAAATDREDSRARTAGGEAAPGGRVREPRDQWSDRPPEPEEAVDR